MANYKGETDCLEEASLQRLPDETLLFILRCLHFKDLVSVSKCCGRFSRLVLDDELWRWQCDHYFLETACQKEKTWRACFIKLYRNFGKYPDYRDIRRAWTKIETYLAKRCPLIKSSLNHGVTESALNAVESRIQEKLPPDFRVSYRIHNGQEVHLSTGLMGGHMMATHRRSDSLLPLKDVAESYRDRGDRSGCVCVAKDQFSNISHHLMAITNKAGFPQGHIYDATAEFSTSNDDCFIAARSFKDWLCSYADKLAEDEYPILDDCIMKFYHEPSCVATTHGITVKPYTCFIPELSIANGSHVQYVFAYRIILEMSADTPTSLSCRLETRHWTITDAEGQVTTVNGPGVVGEHPVMRPGKTFAWVSCCTFNTPTGSMGGHFRFRNLQDGDIVTEVECPCYHMEALPALTWKERQEIMKQLEMAKPELD